MRDVGILLKFRLAFTVVFSAVAGYLLGAPSFILSDFLLLTLGGFAIVGSSNAFNQIWEIEKDAVMARTKDRPLPAGRMKKVEAYLWAFSLGISGTLALGYLNVVTAAFGLLSLMVYVLVYTPMKARSPWAVLVGAVPGAIPFFLGWVSVTGDFGVEPGTLFALQFIWQFPHFWAIAWLGYEEYAKAGYYLLPNRKKDRTATQLSLVYTLWMLFVSILPAFGITGALTLSIPAAVIVIVFGMDVLYHAWTHHKNPSDSAARKLMFATIRYLPMVQITYVLNHYLV